MSQTDDELWTLAEAYEQLTEMIREQTKLKRELRDKILKKLVGKDGNYHARYRGARRVMAVSSTSQDVSVSDLREKYGEEFIQKHVIVRSYTTVNVKEMAKRGPESLQS